MKLFEKILMASEDVKSYLVSGRNDEAEMWDGAVVTIGDLVDHEVYANVKDMNTRAVELGMQDGKRYGIVDYVNVNQVDLYANTNSPVTYRVGDKVYGLAVPKGWATRVRVPQVGDEFFLGDENFVATPTVGQEYGADASGLFNASGVGTFKVKVEYGTNKITGTVNNGMKYFCTVVAI